MRITGAPGNSAVGAARQPASTSDTSSAALISAASLPLM
jgi:hypothetical protein